MTKDGEATPPPALDGADRSEGPALDEGAGAMATVAHRDQTLKWIISDLMPGAEPGAQAGLVPQVSESIQIDISLTPLPAASGVSPEGVTPAEPASPDAVTSAELLLDGPTDPGGDVVGGLPDAPLFAPATTDVTDDDLMMMDGADTPPPEPLAPQPLAPQPPPVAPALQPASSPARPSAQAAPPAPPPPPRTPNGASCASAGVGPGEVAEPAPAPAPPTPEALSRRTLSKRLRPWFEEVFDEDYLRTLPFMTAEQTLREVAFIKEALNPPEGAEILDVACGYGRHAIELGQQGLRITGVDLSLPLLIRAADEAQRRNLPINFLHTDMREMDFDAQFDGAYCVLSSFGYFDEDANFKVAAAMARALKPGARLIIDTLNRDYIVADLPTRVWWEGDGCVVLEEVDFNFHTSRISSRRSVVFADGRQAEQEISIRAYSLHELGRLMQKAGLRVIDVSGSLSNRGEFFGAASRSIVIVCERPAG